MQKQEKIYAFIDSQNLNLSIQECDWKLDKEFIFICQDENFRC